MYEGLKPCPHRHVDDGGRILCGLIKAGDREVSVNLCRDCPVPQINCQHLRATMQKRVATPITVRFATGRVEIWDQEPPSVDFKHAACAEKTMPINSPRDCVGCPLRQPLVIPESAVQIARRNRPAPAPAPLPGTQPVTPRASIISEIPAAEMVERARAMAHNRRVAEKQARPTQVPARNETKSKVILLQEWLAGQLGQRPIAAQPQKPQPDEDGVQDIVYTPIAPQYEEQAGLERCVGWTD